MAKLEQQLEQVGEQLTAIEQQLADPDLYGDGRKAELKQLLQQQAERVREQEQIEADWLEQLEALETLEQSLDDGSV